MTNYIIDKLLGRGSFGRVYLLKDAITGNNRVIKFIKMSSFIGKEIYDNEIKILKKLSKDKCPKHILCLDKNFTYVSKTGNNYIVLITDYIDGISLREFLEKKMMRNLSHDDLIFIVYQLINTFYEIHNKYKIIHKDIKPENIMINPKTLKITIIDFGLSCDSNKCSPGGTQVYMAPEILLNYIQHTKFTFNEGKKSDTFSLGIVLLELLGCENYFKTHSIIKPLESISTLVKMCPIKNDAIEYIISNTLKYNKNDRMDLKDILKYLKKKYKADVLYDSRMSLIQPRKMASTSDQIDSITIKLNDKLKKKYKKDTVNIINIENIEN